MLSPGQASTPYYTSNDVQALADYVKYRLFASIVDANAEATLYDPRLQEFIGDLTVLQFIPAAIDYWGDQLISETTTGTNETLSYPDRVKGLQEIFNEISKRIAKDYGAMAQKYGFRILGTTGATPAVTYGDNGRDILLTSDPWEFDPAFTDKIQVTPFPWETGA